MTLARDEGNRPDTTLDGLQSLKPVIEGGVVTADNASQLSDGASACVVMDRALAERRGLRPLGIYRHIANDGAMALSVSSGAPGGNPAAGQSQSAVIAGIRHSF